MDDFRDYGFLLVDSHCILEKILTVVGTINQGSLKNFLLIAFLLYACGRTCTTIIVNRGCKNAMGASYIFHSIAIADGRSRSGMTTNQSPASKLKRRGIPKYYLLVFAHTNI
jgi:hypothetical protein